MAINDLFYSFTGKPVKRPETPLPGVKIDEELEALIDRAGRDKVFARANSHGWDGKTPPKWVWKAIAAEIIAEEAKL